MTREYSMGFHDRAPVHHDGDYDPLPTYENAQEAHAEAKARNADQLDQLINWLAAEQTPEATDLLTEARGLLFTDTATCWRLTNQAHDMRDKARSRIMCQLATIITGIEE